MFALYELIATLAEAWAAADLRRRLAAWWHVVTHRTDVERPLDVVWIEARDA